MPILGCKGLRIAADLHPNIILFMWLFSLHQVEEKIKIPPNTKSIIQRIMGLR